MTPNQAQNQYNIFYIYNIFKVHVIDFLLLYIFHQAFLIRKLPKYIYSRKDNDLYSIYTDENS